MKLTLQMMPKMCRWVEHDPLEIWESVNQCLDKALEAARSKVGDVKVVALGITNQRETTLVWDRTTGRLSYRTSLFVAVPILMRACVSWLCFTADFRTFHACVRRQAVA